MLELSTKNRPLVFWKQEVALRGTMCDREQVFLSNSDACPSLQFAASTGLHDFFLGGVFDKLRECSSSSVMTVCLVNCLSPRLPVIQAIL